MPLIVMLLFVGNLHGGPAVIQGFDTLAACEAARPVVAQNFPGAGWSRPVDTACVELPR